MHAHNSPHAGFVHGMKLVLLYQKKKCTSQACELRTWVVHAHNSPHAGFVAWGEVGNIRDYQARERSVSVSFCTFVLVKQVNFVSSPGVKLATPDTARRVSVSFCTFALVL